MTLNTPRLENHSSDPHGAQQVDPAILMTWVAAISGEARQVAASSSEVLSTDHEDDAHDTTETGFSYVVGQSVELSDK